MLTMTETASSMKLIPHATRMAMLGIRARTTPHSMTKVILLPSVKTGLITMGMARQIFLLTLDAQALTTTMKQMAAVAEAPKIHSRSALMAQTTTATRSSTSRTQTVP